MIHLRLGIQNSAVSLRHVGWLATTVRQQQPDVRVDLHPVQTRRDRLREEKAFIPGRPRHAFHELFDGLRADEFDAAWLDVRDIPWPLPAGFVLAACAARRNPREAMLHRQGTSFAELPPRTRLATTNEVAQWQIARLRPDIAWVTLGGDLPTRLHKLHLQQADGVIESASDLLALGFNEQAFEFLSTDTMLPTPGQGVWALCRLAERGDVQELAAPLDDAKARLCAATELDFVAELAPPGDVPVAAWARVQRKKLMLDACVADPERPDLVRLSISGPCARGNDLVTALADMFRQRGVRQARR